MNTMLKFDKATFANLGSCIKSNFYKSIATRNNVLRFDGSDLKIIFHNYQGQIHLESLDLFCSN